MCTISGQSLPWSPESEVDLETSIPDAIQVAFVDLNVLSDVPIGDPAEKTASAILENIVNNPVYGAMRVLYLFVRG